MSSQRSHGCDGRYPPQKSILISSKGCCPNDVVKRTALTEEETEKFLSYVLEGSSSRKHYNEIIILLGTGLRASELCGLTKSVIDFQNCRIRVERQLLRDEHGEYYVSKPKTKNGVRYVPMEDSVYKSLQDVILNRKRPEVEYIVDGITGFLFLDREL